MEFLCARKFIIDIDVADAERTARMNAAAADNHEDDNADDERDVRIRLLS